MHPDRQTDDRPDPEPTDPYRAGGDAGAPDRWPLPVRAAIAFGAGAALWTLILLALR